MSNIRSPLVKLVAYLSIVTNQQISNERHGLDTAALKAEAILQGITDEGNLTKKQAFQVLGLNPEANERDIKQAFRKVMLSVHTDTHQRIASAEEIALLKRAGTAVNVAYEIVGKKERTAAPEAQRPEAGETETSRTQNKGYGYQGPEEQSTNSSHGSANPPQGRQKAPANEKPEWYYETKRLKLEELLDLKTFREHMAEVRGRARGEHLKHLLEKSLDTAETFREIPLDGLFSSRVESYLKFNHNTPDLAYADVTRSATMQRLESTLDKIKDPAQLQMVLAFLVDKELVGPKDALSYLEKRAETPAERVTLAAGFLNELERLERPNGNSVRPTDNRDELFNELTGRAISRSLELPDPQNSISAIKFTLEQSARIPQQMDTKYYMIEALSGSTTGPEFMGKLRTFQSAYED
jgi:hypothetical protein